MQTNYNTGIDKYDIMKKKLIYIFAAATLMVCGEANAQNLNSAYFADGYAMGHHMNPAKEYDRSGYVAFPILSNWNIGLKGNLELKDFFKKTPDGTLGTILHPDISFDEAMSGLNNNNKLMLDTRMDILSFGFSAFKGYNTVTLSARTNVGFNMPKEIFSLVKQIENKDYNFSDMNMNLSAWAEIGLSHSRQITDAVRIGVKAKALIGVGYADVNLDNVNMNLENEDEWIVNADASAEVGLKGFTWGQTETKPIDPQAPTRGTYEEINFDNIDLESPGIGGGGVAFDLGAEWDLGKQGFVDGLKVSAAILDLGFIKWNNVATAKSTGEDFIFNGFEDIKLKDEGEDIGDQFEEMGDDFEDLLNLQDGGTGSKSRMLGATLNVGVEYALPMYDKLSIGLLSTTHFQEQYTWNEERLSLTVSPAKMFELSANVAVGTFGVNVGWLLNFHPRGFNLYVGSDHCVGKFMKPMIPLRSNYDINFGIAFPIGKSKIGGKEKKKNKEEDIFI